ncbi:tight adherence protein B [Granulicella rosea]|uniref:Tight adherence protein B n=1 Tax=Granulicella rosea TaxID=474952 RepID=A0A239ERH4_9BACT|nr:type II secretion system F family protein [Granulicella rosea]SNS47276.1 tight adherence protein B [Granulicella rosea]
MAILVLTFLVTMSMMFAGLLLALRPTREQKAIQRRITVIKRTHGELGGDKDEIAQYLSAPETGAFGWIEAQLADSRISESLKLMLLRADSTTAVGMVIVTIVGTGAAAAAIAFLATGMPLVAAPVALVGAYIPILVFKIRGSMRLKAFNNALPDAIEMMSRCLRAGHSMSSAIGIIADQAAEPVKTEFAEVFKKQNFGLPMRDALMQMLDRIPSQDLRVLFTGILVQKDTGGNLVDILDRIVHVIRERQRIKGDIQTHTAQGRLTGWILCMLPVVMLGLINFINPGYSRVLFVDPTGQKFLGGGVFLLCVGVLIIRSIINGIEI